MCRCALENVFPFLRSHLSVCGETFMMSLSLMLRSISLWRFHFQHDTPAVCVGCDTGEKLAPFFSDSRRVIRKIKAPIQSNDDSFRIFSPENKYFSSAVLSNDWMRHRARKHQLERDAKWTRRLGFPPQA